MSVTRAQTSERERYLGQIDKLVNSHVLHGSESLCKLLRYLAEHALDHPGSSLKEYQIATEVFGRPHDFDPQHDSTIRVQAGRLRLKLAEYYGSEGAEDSLIVEVPKGTYVVSFHHRAAMPAKARAAGWRELEPEGFRGPADASQLARGAGCPVCTARRRARHHRLSAGQWRRHEKAARAAETNLSRPRFQPSGRPLSSGRKSPG